VIEFTGERVIPGEVPVDLWNEHIARYAFAARLARYKRVLDVGCGTGYGSAELGRVATQVVGCDISAEALVYAHRHYASSKVHFIQAACTCLPLNSASFDLVVAFELIEHLADWRTFLEETRRVLDRSGQCVISTPNKYYYQESRGPAGLNPYHQHEFTFEEFRKELEAVFPHVSFFLQNHADGIVFQPVDSITSIETRMERAAAGPDESNFFIAVCALAPQTGSPTFFFVPRAANILKERELHIRKLDEEITKHKATIIELTEERDKLLDMFARQKDELDESNRWAQQLDKELEHARELLNQLERELASRTTAYEEQIQGLENEKQKIAAWAEKSARELTEKCAELAHAVDVLHETEKALEERTAWALSLDERVRKLEAVLARLLQSRWVKLGCALGVTPKPQDL